MEEAYSILKISYSDDIYIRLRNAIVSHLHVTNCRRANEVEKLKFDDVNTLVMEGEDCRVEVRGKRTKPVPIIFNKNVYTYLNVLIENRLNAKISIDNPFIFSNIHDLPRASLLSFRHVLS